MGQVPHPMWRGPEAEGMGRASRRPACLTPPQAWPLAWRPVQGRVKRALHPQELSASPSPPPRADLGFSSVTWGQQCTPQGHGEDRGGAVCGAQPPPATPSPGDTDTDVLPPSCSPPFPSQGGLRRLLRAGRKVGRRRGTPGRGAVSPACPWPRGQAGGLAVLRRGQAEPPAQRSAVRWPGLEESDRWPVGRRRGPGRGRSEMPWPVRGSRPVCPAPGNVFLRREGRCVWGCCESGLHTGLFTATCCLGAWLAAGDTAAGPGTVPAEDSRGWTGRRGSGSGPAQPEERDFASPFCFPGRFRADGVLATF